jgi:hypothetical protein
MKLQYDKWLYGLLQATIGGAAASGSAWMGTAVGHAISDKIPVLDWRTMGFVLLTSTITNLFFFLKQSPLPAIEDSDPAAFRKTVENAAEVEKEKENKQ